MRNIRSIFLYSAGLLTGLGFAVANISSAVESIIPYQFKDGEVISADALNDLFSRIKDGNQGVLSESELNGVWTCNTYDPSAASNNFQAANFSTDSTTGLQTLQQSWNFSNSGKALNVNLARLGGINNNSTGVCTGQTSFDYSARVVESTLMLTGSGTCTTGTGFIVPLTKVSPYKFRGNIASTLVSCVANQVPPSIPSGVTANISGSGVTVAWTDNGGSPTNFMIYKKSNNAFTQIGTVDASTTTFNDTNGSSGNLYRVASTNSTGTSLKSSAAIAK